MLDHLKKDREAGFGAKERIKLTIYVAGLVVIGASIYMGTRLPGRAESAKKGRESTPQATPEPEPGPLLDPAELGRLVKASGAEPNRWSAPGIEYVRAIQRTGRLGPVTDRLSPAALADRDVAEARGLGFEVEGRVISVSREEYLPDPGGTGEPVHGRLWSVVLEGKDGGRAIAFSYSLASEAGEGPPRDDKPPRVPAERIAADQWVIARGVYVQRRVGSLGDVQFRKPVPAVYATRYRITYAPQDRNPIIDSLKEALWSQVRDRTNRETRVWNEDAMFEVVQWAQHQGYEACRKAVLHGPIGYQTWGESLFERWKAEVRVGPDAPRPFTEGARGKVFKVRGIIGELLDYDWDRIPRNPWGVDHLQVVTILSDDYHDVALRLILPFPIDTFPHVTGKRKEHLNLYGVFVKNLTYDTKFNDQDGTAHPVTVPMFVVLHAEPYPEGAAERRMRTAMLWVAAAMLLFAALFYFVLIRGGGRQEKRMEEHRMALRRRVRARGRAAAPGEEGGGPAPPADDETS